MSAFPVKVYTQCETQSINLLSQQNKPKDTIASLIRNHEVSCNQNINDGMELSYVFNCIQLSVPITPPIACDVIGSRSVGVDFIWVLWFLPHSPKACTIL